MTDREKAIVMAYTGSCTLTGDKLDVFYEYIEEILGRPFMIHDLVRLEKEIKEKSKPDFVEICKETQESCDDGYIKVPKKALKYRTAGIVAYNAEWLKNHFDIERAAICGAQEPCEDCISRQAVLDLAKFDGRKNLGSIIHTFDVEQLPPVKPTEKTGHWISNAEDDLKISEYTCSNCKGLSDEDSDFCPKCGSYNGGTQHERP